MKIYGYVLLTFLILGFIVILAFAAKSKKFFKTILLNAALGIAALAIIDLTARFSGVYIPINQWTAGISATYGIPAIFGILVINLLGI